ncbi:MAG: class I SAM-dependent methyltransferase [Burkholderiales bacterium]
MTHPKSTERSGEPSVDLAAITGPLLTLRVVEALQAARNSGLDRVDCSLDLDRSATSVGIGEIQWHWKNQQFPYMANCKDRTIYHWTSNTFAPVSRYSGRLIKLVPTEWGAPTFEIDGIKMLPTAQVSPYEDAKRKVGLIEPRGKIVLDTCGGLGYFAAWCLQGDASQVLSFEKSADVIWLRGINPWSPTQSDRLILTHGDIATAIALLDTGCVDAILHDPPRFGIAGELYSQSFYDQLARVLKRRGRLFHYTGSPNKLTSGRDVPMEVTKRLRQAGFTTELNGDGVMAQKK